MSEASVSSDTVGASGATSTPRPKILVIDDEKAIRGLFRDVLESWGYAADTAPSGAAGLEMFRQSRYDVVLTDYLMPGMSGLEVLLAMRRENPAVAVILVTGSVFDAQLEEARRSNIPVLCKPVQLEELKVAVDRVVSRA